jgi:large subunit ribosomal protein L28
MERPDSKKDLLDNLSRCYAAGFKRNIPMPRSCILTGKKPSSGRSYSLRGIAKKKKGIGLKITGCTNRRFLPNLVVKRLWVPEEKRFVTLRLSTAALRTIDKKGIGAVLSQIRRKGKRI